MFKRHDNICWYLVLPRGTCLIIALLYSHDFLLFSLSTRGYAFLRYLTPVDAESAIKELNEYEIQPGHKINVTKSEGNKRLYMGNILKEKGKDELLVELKALFPGVTNIFTQEDINEPKLNRGMFSMSFIIGKL